MQVRRSTPRSARRKPFAPLSDNPSSAKSSAKKATLVAKIMLSGRSARRSVGRRSPTPSPNVSTDELSFLNQSSGNDSASTKSRRDSEDNTATSLPLSLFDSRSPAGSRQSTGSTGSSNGDHTADLGAMLHLLGRPSVDSSSDRSMGSDDSTTQPLDEVAKPNAAPRSVRRPEDRQTCSPGDIAELLKEATEEAAATATTPPPAPRTAKTPRSILRRGTPGTGRSVVFGSPKCAEFKKQLPITRMTPLTSEETRQFFTMDPRSASQASDGSDSSDSDEETAHNSLLLAEWDEEDDVGAGAGRRSSTSGRSASPKATKRARSSSGRSSRSSRSSASHLEDVSMHLDFAGSPEPAEEGAPSSALAIAAAAAAAAQESGDDDSSPPASPEPTPAPRSTRRSPRLAAKRQRMSTSPGAAIAAAAPVAAVASSPASPEADADVDMERKAALRRSPRLAKHKHKQQQPRSLHGARLPPPPASTPPAPSPGTVMRQARARAEAESADTPMGVATRQMQRIQLQEEAEAKAAALARDVANDNVNSSDSDSDSGDDVAAAATMDLRAMAPLPSPARVRGRRARRRASVCPTDLPSRSTTAAAGRASRSRARRASVSRLDALEAMPPMPAAPLPPPAPTPVAAPAAASTPSTAGRRDSVASTDETATFGAVAALLATPSDRDAGSPASSGGADTDNDNTADLGAINALLMRGRESVDSLPEELRGVNRRQSSGSRGDDTCDVGAIADLFAQSPGARSVASSGAGSAAGSAAAATPDTARLAAVMDTPATAATASTAGDHTATSAALRMLLPTDGPAVSVAPTPATVDDRHGDDTVGSVAFGRLLAGRMSAATPATARLSVSTAGDDTATSGAIAQLLGGAAPASSTRGAAGLGVAATPASVATSTAGGDQDMSLVTATPATVASASGPSAAHQFDIRMREDDTLQKKSLRDLLATAGRPEEGDSVLLDRTEELGSLRDLARGGTTPHATASQRDAGDSNSDSDSDSDGMELTGDYAGLLSKRGSVGASPAVTTQAPAQTTTPAGDRSTASAASMELTGDYAGLLSSHNASPAAAPASVASTAATSVRSTRSVRSTGSMRSTRSAQSAASSASAKSRVSVASSSASAASSASSLNEADVVDELRGQQREDLMLQVLGVTPKRRPPTPRQLSKLSARSKRILGLDDRESFTAGSGDSDGDSDVDMSAADNSMTPASRRSHHDDAVTERRGARASTGSMDLASLLNGRRDSLDSRISASTGAGAGAGAGAAGSSARRMSSVSRASSAALSVAGFVSEPSYDASLSRHASDAASGHTASPVDFAVSPMSPKTAVTAAQSAPRSAGAGSHALAAASSSAVSRITTPGSQDGSIARLDVSPVVDEPSTPTMAELASSSTNNQGTSDSNFADISEGSIHSAAMDDAIHMAFIPTPDADQAEADESAAGPVGGEDTGVGAEPSPAKAPSPQRVDINSVDAMFEVAGLDPAIFNASTAAADATDADGDVDTAPAAAERCLEIPNVGEGLPADVAAVAASAVHATVVVPHMSDLEWPADYLSTKMLPSLRHMVSHLKQKLKRRRPAAFAAVSDAAFEGRTEVLAQVAGAWQSSKLAAEVELLQWRAKGLRGVDATLGSHSEELAALRQRVADLKSDLSRRCSEAGAELEACRKQQAANARVAGLQSDVEEQAAVVAGLDARKAELEARNAQLGDEASAISGQVAKCQAVIAAAPTDADVDMSAEGDDATPAPVAAVVKAAADKAAAECAARRGRVVAVAATFRAQRKVGAWTLASAPEDGSAMVLVATHGGVSHRIHVAAPPRQPDSSEAGAGAGAGEGAAAGAGAEAAGEQPQPELVATLAMLDAPVDQRFARAGMPPRGGSFVPAALTRRMMAAQGCDALFAGVHDAATLQAALQESALRWARVEAACQELDALSVPYAMTIEEPPAEESDPAVMAVVGVTFFRAIRPLSKFRVSFALRAGYPFANVAVRDVVWHVGQTLDRELRETVARVPAGFQYMKRVCDSVRAMLKKQAQLAPAVPSFF